MTDFYQTPKFQLPANLTVEGVACVCVHIPDDPEYFAQLIGHLDALKWSRNFAHDPTGLGAGLVSRSWQRALESEAILMSCGVVFRQSTVNPCILEQSTDGGATWTTAFNYNLCSSSITVPAPYPGSSTGASDAAGAIMTNVLMGLLSLTADICAWSRDEYIANATAYMRLYDAGYANPTALGKVYDTWCAMTGTEQSEFLNECTFLEMKQEAENCIDPEGAIQWLDCMFEQIGEWISETTSDLMRWLLEAANAMTGNGWQTAAGGNSGGGAGFGSSCTWTHTWNAANGWAGWNVYTGDPNYGTLSGGVWHSVDAAGYTSLLVTSPALAVDCALTRVVFSYTITGTAAPFGQHRLMIAGEGHGLIGWVTIPWDVASHVFDHTQGIGMRQILFDIEAPSGYINIDLTEVTFYGNGLDPF